MVLELWSKNSKTNQNAGFFKPQYLTENLRYEVEFLDMTVFLTQTISRRQKNADAKVV